MAIWLAVYLGVGVIVLGTMIPAYLRERPSKWARLMMEEIRPGQLSLRPEAQGAVREVANGLKHCLKRPREEASRPCGPQRG
jgi:hypothetical protein